MNQSVRMLRLPEVLRKTALSRSQIYRLIGEGDFPRQVQLGKRAAGWVENEIDEWLLGCVTRSRRLEDDAPRNSVSGANGE